VRLYRSVVGTPYTGPGSFWSPDPSVSKKYGKRGGRRISTDARGKVLKLSSDDELVEALTIAGIRDAEERVLDADWFSDDVYEALRQFGYTWIERPVDASVSLEDVEWIYVGKQPLRWNAA
jgi:hypothetical protein